MTQFFSSSAAPVFRLHTKLLMRLLETFPFFFSLLSIKTRFLSTEPFVAFIQILRTVAR